MRISDCGFTETGHRLFNPQSTIRNRYVRIPQFILMLFLSERKVVRRGLTGSVLLFAVLLLLSVSCNSQSNIQSGEVPLYTYEVVNSWPHLTSHFTQGLVYHD